MGERDRAGVWLTQPPTPSGLRRQRRTALAWLWLERGLPALWPLLGLLGGLLCLALLGVPERLPAPLHAAGLLAAAVAIGVLARRLRLPRPSQADADRRLESVSGIAHRPLATLADRLARDAGPEERALWALHRARAAASLVRLRPGRPRPVLPARDPRALRALLLLGVVSAAVIAGPDAGERLWQALAPRFAPAVAVPPLEVRAWVAPPAFTGLPPLLLAPGPATIPAGSRLTVNLSGGRGEPPVLRLPDATERRFDDSGEGSFQAHAEPTLDGTLEVRRDGIPLAAWTLTLQPDLAPVVTWVQPPGVQRGRNPQLRLPWRATHAYGVTGMAAELVLRDRPAAPPMVLPLPLPGERLREASGVGLADVTADPRAGLPVVATLVGRDGAGLVGRSAGVPLVLPQRRFQHPGARAILAIRQHLARDADPAAAAAGLRALPGQAALWQGGVSPPELADAATALDLGVAAVDATQQRLWELALRLEETTPARTAASLRRAQQELRAAVDKTPADPADIRSRADALQRALERHAQALAQQAQRPSPGTRPITPEQRRALEQALQQLRADAEQSDAAHQDMAELDRELDRMREASRGPAEQKRAETKKRGREQMTALQDLVRREAGLIDGAERRLADAASPPDALDAARARDRAVQQALRRMLGELMQQHGDLTGAVPKNLGEADQAMRDAVAALRDAHDDQASAAALRAVQALQQGGQEMDQSLARRFGQPKPGDDQGRDASGQDQDAEGQDGDGQEQDANGQTGQDGPGGEPGSGQEGDGQGQAATQPGDGGPVGPDGRPMPRRLDPLGRPLHEGAQGVDGGLDTKVPEEMERARGRAVQDELRRREAQRTRPLAELDYIGRLLAP